MAVHALAATISVFWPTAVALRVRFVFFAVAALVILEVRELLKRVHVSSGRPVCSDVTKNRLELRLSTILVEPQPLGYVVLDELWMLRMALSHVLLCETPHTLVRCV